MEVNGYRLSHDRSLWKWTSRGQEVIPTAVALDILEEIDTPKARVMASLIRDADPTQYRAKIEARLATKSGRNNWSTFA